jgi:hypothetical protein
MEADFNFLKNLGMKRIHPVQHDTSISTEP